MQSKKTSLSYVAIPAVFAAVILLVISAVQLPADAQAQSKYSNDTFTLVTRSDQGRIRMRVQGKGDHCWVTTSGDRFVGIGMGDELCTASAYDVPDSVGVIARVSPSKISFRLNGKSYSINDSNTVKSARSLFDSLVAIEAQQSDLAGKQRALGERQRELGRQQRDVKINVPDMSADILKIEADAKRLSAEGGTQSELGDLQSELGDLQSRIGDLQSEAGDAESKFGDQQSDLGDQQSQFGDQQAELGNKAETVAVDIANKLRAMLTQSISSGTAKPE